MQNISELLLNTLRQNTLTALFLLSFLLFKGADAETSQENKFKAFVSNPNGMFLYADCKEKKNRIFLPYQTELSKSEETVSGKNDSETFCKYEFNNKIYYNSCDENPVLEFRKPDSESFTYPHSAKVSIYRIPFQNQEVISEIPEFSMMKIHAVSEEWYEAEFNGKKGCIRKENCIEAAPSDQVKFLLELKEKETDGYFVVSSSKPVFFPHNEQDRSTSKKSTEEILRGKPISDIAEYLEGSNQEMKKVQTGKGTALKSIKTIVLKGSRYYMLTYPSGYDLKYLWISEKDGKFLSKNEYSEYTFSKSKHARNSELQKLMKQFMSTGIDFQKLELKKIDLNKSIFYFIKIESVSKEQNFIIAEKTETEIRYLSENLNSSLNTEDGTLILTDMLEDLDGDGSPEFLYRIKSRTGLGEEAGRSFGAFKKGKLVPIAFIGDENGSFVRCETKGKRLNCLFETENKKIIKEFIFLNGRLFEKISDGTADKGDGKDFVQIKKELFRKIPIPGKDE
ncbi:MAG TPA: hypothetical protein PKV80_13515 [Leptospiraceae bacterium]|nr:hypothetical protein [Leptospiraceae bacterium]